MRNLQKIIIFALENSILIYNYIINCWSLWIVSFVKWRRMASFVSCKRNIFSFLRREQKSPEVLPRSFEPVLFPAERTTKPQGFASELWILRREQDSNLRTGFAGYTLSRRASSTTRAPLLFFADAKVRIKFESQKLFSHFHSPDCIFLVRWHRKLQLNG